jgi:hypothetical protein
VEERGKDFGSELVEDERDLPELSIQNGAGVTLADTVGVADIVRLGVIDFVRVGDTVFEGVTEGVTVIVGV